MNLLKEDLQKEIQKIDTALKNQQDLKEIDLKIMLLNLLNEEDQHENK